MSEIQSGSKDLLDTTDCLEAVGVFKGWKNFFFVIILICLLLLQASFWVVDRGCIAIPGKTGAITEPNAPQKVEPMGQTSEVQNMRAPTPPEAPEPQRAPGQQPENQSGAEPNGVSGFSSFDSRIQRAVAWPSDSFLSGITFDKLAWLIRFLNAVLILSTILYCLTLLFGLKVSMHGRLGGINHISRAFFLSLILVVFLLPWQTVFGNILCGALYQPGELAQWYSKESEDIFDLVLYYLRFSGLGVLILLLLILSQIRSVRWAKAILRRLEII